MVNNYDHKYYKKYIKYKNKYLQYKRILHGGTPQQLPSQPSQPPLSVIVLASHQNAIGEFLSVLVEGFTETRKKIKNCACLEIAKVDGIVRVRMVHQGELDPKDKKKEEDYFTIKEFNSKNYQFKNEHESKIGDNVKILLVRHGNGPHNAHPGIMGGIVKISDGETYTDPLLTSLGISQAERASHLIINTIRSYRRQCTIHLCSSRLRRAIQTAAIIGYNISRSNIPNVSMVLKVIIIPGVEEVVDDSGKTENTLFSIKINPENRSICPIDSNMPKNCNNLFLTTSTTSTTPTTPTTPTTLITITKIGFIDDVGSIPISSINIPVDFMHMRQHIETIFPFSKRINTAFNKLGMVIQPLQTSEMQQTSETQPQPQPQIQMPKIVRVVGGSNKNKHK